MFLKMMFKIQIIIFLCIFCVLQSIMVHSSTRCERSCGGGGRQLKDLPSPFGYSSGCKIRLNCTDDGNILIHDFPVQSISADTILIDLPAECGRPIQTLRHLFSRNYAPTSHNGILLRNCSSPVTACVIPTTMVQTRFELKDCGERDNNSISCYSEQNNNTMFIDYLNVTLTGCRSLFSAISTASFVNSSAVSLDVQVVQLGWWLEGNCEQCSEDTTCIPIVSPIDGRPGYRCRCLDGFFGDGYKGSLGCKSESSSCNPSKYLAGRCGGRTRVGILVGGVVAAASLLVSLALVCCFLRQRTISKTRNRTKRQLSEATGITIPIYPYKEIQKATNSFSDKRRLGTGAYGTVYSGKLHTDEWVAVKRITRRSDTNSIEQVMNEIKLISSVSHPNLVRLLGCSIENGEQILVYEYMPNGTLSQHLQRERGNGLSWPVRLTIVAQTAKAIAHLHSATNPPIYHRDIKSSNILLDYNYKTKVADFGLSRLGMTMTESSHISTAPQGTPGYLDPQYHQNFHLSDKSDVYSFGVVLVEIITALKALDFSRRQNEVNLASFAVDRIGKGCLDEIIDPFLEPNKDPWTLSSLHKVAELAFRCLAFQSDMRPSMVEVAEELELISLSRWTAAAAFSKESITTASLESSSCSSSSSSNASEKPLKMKVNDEGELENKGVFGSANSVDNEKDFSPVSVVETWISEDSSPSSNTLLTHVG